MVACELDKSKLKRAKSFCRTFISSISLLLDQARIFISGIPLLDLASSNLVLRLLDPIGLAIFAKYICKCQKEQLL